MKKILNIFIVLSVGFVCSCGSYDELDPESIFEVAPEVIDQSKFSAPLDSFCKRNFLDTYNLDFRYKMQDIASDVKKNLTPASYDKCEEMAVLVKYLWYDIYRNHVGESAEEGYEFLKKNSPRIIHLVGSKNMNPIQGTEILGTAEGGIKITLYRSNTLDISNLNYCNEYFFHTMHHEFGHQLCSRYVVPLDYRQLSSGFYDALGWQETCDSVALGDGFISQYSRNNYEDDFVEMLSRYVCATPQQWAKRLSTAQWQWEEVTYDKDSNGWKEWEKIARRGGDIDSIGYLKEKSTYKLTIVRKVIKREVTENKNDYAYPITNANGERVIEYMMKEPGKTGTELILKKLEMLKTWLSDNYNIDLDEIRFAVLARSYVLDLQPGEEVDDLENIPLALDSNGNPINRIVQPYQGYSTLLEYLVENMRKYKTIDEFDFGY